MLDIGKEKKEIQLLTEKYVDKLHSIWAQMFNDDTCKLNFKKLIDHTTNFYDELVLESLKRKSTIENEINGLKREAVNLKRLLESDGQLPNCQPTDVPLQTLQFELVTILKDMGEQLRLRREHIRELLLEQEVLCNELGVPQRILLNDPLPTAQEIEIFRKHLQILCDERVVRMNKVSNLRKEIEDFMQALNINLTPEDEYSLLNLNNIKLNKETIDRFERLHSKYGSQVKELEESIQSMRKKLDSLWDRLQTSESTKLEFAHYKDCNQHTYDVLYSEIQRCESLMSKNIKLFVEQVRGEIEKMWNKTLKSDKQRHRFVEFNSTCYTDDLLVLHEMELEDLKLYYEDNKQIFELFANRNILWERMNALEAKVSEPGRYNNRGGHLLKEEKERKTISTKLPKIEQQIYDLVKKFEEKGNVPFLVYGENIIDFIAAQWNKKRHEKELLQLARKNGKSAERSCSKENSTMGAYSSMKVDSSGSSLRKMPTISLLSNTVTSEKGKFNSSHKYSSRVKRSLMQALNSPNAFLKPSTSKDVQYNSNGITETINKKHNILGSTLKPTLKKSKLIATTIRRRSGRHSNNLKKRRSGSKTIPKIVVEYCQSDGYSTDCNINDSYDAFQKCIEPTLRSSIIQNITLNESVKFTKPISNETPNHNPISPAGSVTHGRKLTTKNLPIIM